MHLFQTGLKSKMIGRRVKLIEIWNSGALALHIWGTCDLVVYKVIWGTFGVLVAKWPATYCYFDVKIKLIFIETFICSNLIHLIWRARCTKCIYVK